MVAFIASPVPRTPISACRQALISRPSFFFKPDAANLLREELSRPSYVADRIQLGSNTDCYQPVEKRLDITRDILEVLAQFHHPVGITTKNHLVTRDIDILAPMAERAWRSW